MSAPAPITPRPCPIPSWRSSRSRGRGDRSRIRRSADRRQHRRADPDPSARAWCGHRGLFDHQIHRRPRHIDWRRHRRWRQFRLGTISRTQPALNTPDPSYHGAVWTQAVKPIGPVAYIIKARTTLLRDSARRSRLSTPSSPCKGSKRCRCASTPLPERQRRGRLAGEAAGSTKVIHPSLRTANASPRGKYLKGGYGALVGFELAGGRRRAAPSSTR